MTDVNKNKKTTEDLYITPEPPVELTPEELKQFEEIVFLTNAENGLEVEVPKGLINMNLQANTYRKALFRDEEIYKLLSILTAKDKSNALIVGESGVGKTNLVEQLARWLTIDSNPVAKQLLADYTLYELPISAMISGNKLIGQLEETVEKILDFASNPLNKCILFIDNIHQLVDTNQNSESKIGEMFKRALSMGNIKMIGATTTQESKMIQQNPAFERRWAKLILTELTQEQTSTIIRANKKQYENFHQIKLPDNLIDELVKISAQYRTTNNHQPDAALNLLDKALSEQKIIWTKMYTSTNAQVKQYINEHEPTLTLNQIKQTAMNLISITSNNASSKQLTQHLGENIIGQANVKKVLINKIERMQLNLLPQSKPASFLFAGPSGTGKTEVAKQLALHLFGQKDNMIYLNMTEYTSEASITKIIGASEGYIGSNSKHSYPFDTLESKPYQIILLDEFEKAHPDIQRLFMQALDEGYVYTNRNTKIDFSRSIIIATTNAGVFELSEKHVGFATPAKQSTPTNKDNIAILSKYFPIELLNRFENIVMFDAISKKDYAKILVLKYNQLMSKILSNHPNMNIHPKNISFDAMYDNEIFQDLLNKTYDPTLNGRPAERTMKQYIENNILEQRTHKRIRLFESVKGVTNQYAYQNQSTQSNY